MKKKQKKRVIIHTDKPLTKEQRRNYSKDHPGERLALHLRYPDFPLYVSLVALVFQVIVLLQIL